MHTKNFKNENFKTEEKLANKLFGVSFAFCYGSSSRSEIRKAGHVLAIHLLALQINIFIFGVWPHGWLMLLSLISENWCDVKNGFENGEGGKSDTEKKRTMENWPALLNINHQRIISLFKAGEVGHRKKREQNMSNREDNRLRIYARKLCPMKRRGTVFHEFFIPSYSGSSLSWFPKWIGRKMFINLRWKKAPSVAHKLHQILTIRKAFDMDIFY